jgi:hypothetical protein
MKTKICSKCKRELSITEFYKNKSRKDGLNFWCKKCQLKCNNFYHQKHKEKINEYKKEYRKEHKKEIKIFQKKYRQKHKDESKRYREEHKEELKEYDLKRKYNISLKDYNFLLQKQNYKCAVCNKVFQNGKNTHIDHNHKTGKIRGLLCGKCNKGMGLFEDNLILLEEAIKYLQRG